MSVFNDDEGHDLHCSVSHHDVVVVVHRALLISPVGPFPTTEDPPRDEVGLEKL